MKKRAGLIIIGIVILGLASYYWYWTNSPKYSLLQIKNSIKKHDVEGFNKYVDVESLVDRLINQIMETNTAETKEAKNEWERTGQNMAKGLMVIMKPRIAKAAKEQIEFYIEKGNFEEKVNSQTRETVFSPEDLLKKPELNKCEFGGIEYVKKDGEIALVGVQIYYKNYDASLTLDVKMRKKNGYWQVAEISNFVDYLRNLEAIKNKRLEQLNEQIMQAMNKALVIDNIQKRSVGDRWGIRNKVILICDLSNYSEKDIVAFKAKFLFKNSNGYVFSTIAATVEDTQQLKSRKKIFEAPIGFEINRFNEGDKILFQTPANLLNIGVEMQFIKFSDGSELRLKDEV